ncbi:MAG: porin [Opitutaceae bacterium]|nr:porin [Opitutaceae bacterium]
MNHWLSLRLVVAIAILPLGIALPCAIAQDADEDEIRLLREQIRLLDQKLRSLEKKQAEREQAAIAASAIAAKTAVVSADSSGFSISSTDKAYKLSLKALVQVDHRLFLNEKTIPGTSTSIAQNTFLLRRIRPILSGTLGGIFDFSIVSELGAGDATTSSAGLFDAWISARLSPTMSIKVGKFTSPVALEAGTSRHFIEAPFVNAILPNRDIGVEFIGSTGDGLVEYRIGAYNGARDNTAAFARDVDNDKSIAGRLTLNPFAGGTSVLKSLSIGVGASVGREEGSAAGTLQAPVTNAQQTLISFGSLISDGEHVRLSPSVSYYSGPTSFVGEYAWTKQQLFRGTTAFDSRSTAWRATLGHVLTGEDSTPRGVAPRVNFVPGQSWGAFELVGRISGIRMDDALFASDLGALPNVPTSANATGATAFGGGINWFMSRNLTFLLNYEYTDFDGNTRRPAESALFSRAQLNF